MSAYYNEHDPKAAAWLRALIEEGQIAPGVVDERNIQDVRPNELSGYRQCHFFAGIGGWSLALRLAGWPDDEPVWTGSCPCQPYSIAIVDQAQGSGDPRDLWSCFFELVRQRQPPAVFGEQVKNAIGWGWWDRAKMDLEGAGYAAAAAIMRGDAAGASHQRKRLYWMAHSGGQGREGLEHFNCLSVSAQEAFTEHGNPLAGARSALAGDFSCLLPSYGVSVQMERDALKGYGNAIVPQVAAIFIEESMSIISEFYK